MRRWLDETGEDARVLADGAFTDGFLLRQRHGILHQLELLARPARVIVFPGARSSTSISKRSAHRWVSGAAVAGLLLGIVAGRTFDYARPAPSDAATIEASGPGGGPAGLADSSLAAGTAGAADGSVEGFLPESEFQVEDEDFLVEFELALGTTQVHELQAIDALTPSLEPVSLRR
jgi:hypothetical protein